MDVIRDDPTVDPRSPAGTQTYPTGATTPPIAPNAPAYEHRTYHAPATPVATAPPVETRERTVIDAEETPRFSVGGTFLGWAVASFFTLVFVTLVTALVTANYGSDLAITAGEIQQGGLVLMIATGLAILAAYAIGGYAAGRIALWNGAAHGAATVVWAVLFTIVAIVGGTALANYANVTPALNVDDLRTLTTTSVAGIVVALVIAALGGALGGNLGERYHERRVDTTSRRRTYRRGRTV